MGQVMQSIIAEQVKYIKSLPLEAADRVYDIQNRAIEAVVTGGRAEHFAKEIAASGDIEVGAAVADHAYKKPSEVVMEVGFAGGGALLDFASNLTATSLLGLSPQQTYQELLDLQESRIPFDVVTGKRLYSNMLIRALEVTTDKTTENVLSAVLTLREVLISRTQQITVADKTNMKEGASTSAVQNSGNKTTKPPDTSLLKSITGNVVSLLGGG